VLFWTFIERWEFANREEYERATTHSRKGPGTFMGFPLKVKTKTSHIRCAWANRDSVRRRKESSFESERKSVENNPTSNLGHQAQIKLGPGSCRRDLISKSDRLEGEPGLGEDVRLERVNQGVRRGGIKFNPGKTRAGTHTSFGRRTKRGRLERKEMKGIL